MNCRPIGTVRSPVTDGVDRGWGAVVSEICIESDLAPGLLGLECFSHLVVVFDMHRSTWTSESDLIRRPRGLADMPLLGVFAQRAKHRPNAIGITTVELLCVDGNVLTVRGLDAIDGTPVIDIKPYFPQFDAPAAASCPEWVDRLMTGYF